MKRTALLLVALALCVPGISHAAVTSCGGERTAILGWRGGVGGTPSARVAGGSCDFVSSCPMGTVGGCTYSLSIDVSGTGLVEGQINGPFGVLRCGLAFGSCSNTASAFVPAGTTGPVDCSVTGAAVEVTFSCSAVLS